jgi:hypothetical protein
LVFQSGAVELADNMVNENNSRRFLSAMGTKFRRHTIIELSLLAFFNPFLGRLGT